MIDELNRYAHGTILGNCLEWVEGEIRTEFVNPDNYRCGICKRNKPQHRLIPAYASDVSPRSLLRDVRIALAEQGVEVPAFDVDASAIDVLTAYVEAHRTAKSG